MNRIVQSIGQIEDPYLKQSCTDRHVKWSIRGVDYSLLRSESKVEDFSSLNEFLHVDPYSNNIKEIFQFNSRCESFIKKDGSIGPLGEEILKNIENEKLSTAAYDQQKADAERNGIPSSQISDKRYAVFLDETLASRIPNLQEVCPKFDTFSEAEKKHFWVWTFAAMAQVESSCISGHREGLDENGEAVPGYPYPNKYKGQGLYMMEPFGKGLEGRSISAGNPNPERACNASTHTIRYDDSTNIRCAMDTLSLILRGAHTCPSAAAKIGRQYIREKENYSGCSKNDKVRMSSNYWSAMRESDNVCSPSLHYKKKINIFIKMYKPCGANFEAECGHFY